MIRGAVENQVAVVGMGGMSYQNFRQQLVTKEVVLLGAFLILLQMADGILTMLGVKHFGTSMEGNLLLRTLMHQFGYCEALVLTKIFCIIVIIRLTTLASTFSWVKQALAAMCHFYLFAAVFPWTYILSSVYVG